MIKFVWHNKHDHMSSHFLQQVQFGHFYLTRCVHFWGRVRLCRPIKEMVVLFTVPIDYYSCLDSVGVCVSCVSFVSRFLEFGYGLKSVYCKWMLSPLQQVLNTHPPFLNPTLVHRNIDYGHYIYGTFEYISRNFGGFTVQKGTLLTWN